MGLFEYDYVKSITPAYHLGTNLLELWLSEVQFYVVFFIVVFSPFFLNSWFDSFHSKEVLSIPSESVCKNNQMCQNNNFIAGNS